MAHAYERRLQVLYVKSILLFCWKERSVWCFRVRGPYALLDGYENLIFSLIYIGICLLRWVTTILFSLGIHLTLFAAIILW